MEKLKTDQEFGYGVSLNAGRPVHEGHTLFHFDTSMTEVEAIKELIGEFMDVSSPESIANFNRYKIDFGLSILDNMIIVLTEKMVKTNEYLGETQAELDDISHRIIKPSLSGRVMTADEKMSLIEMQESLLILRRDLKDTLAAQKVLIENLEKSRNFIFTMNQRMYKPKSKRFEKDPDFFIGKAVDNVTKVNIENKS